MGVVRLGGGSWRAQETPGSSAPFTVKCENRKSGPEMPWEAGASVFPSFVLGAVTLPNCQ